MADGEVKFDTKLDTSGLDEGLKDLKVKLNNLGVETEKSTKKEKEFNKELDKTADKTADAGKAAEKATKAVEKATKKNKNLGDILETVKEKVNGTTIAGIAAAAAIKKTVDVLNDCAAAYRVQQNAEEALQVAAKNNPYLNNESVYNLRQFASELQSLSEIGDEVSLQVMSQLAATGRNEEQIMQIMSAAADMAAVTGQDLASAAQQLNATLNGNAGALGRQIGAINNLTKEELENGTAIELVAQQYKGSAAATADVEVQLSNSWGDFKENIGRGWQEVTQPVKQFFLDVLNDINEATAKTNALKDARKDDKAGIKTAAGTKLLLTDAQSRLTQLQEINKNYVKETTETVKTLEDLQAEWDAKYGKMNPRMRRDSGAPDRPKSTGTTNKKGGAYLEAAAQENEKEIERLGKEVERLTKQYTELKDAEDKAAAAKEAAAQEIHVTADDYAKKSNKNLEESLHTLEVEAKAKGEAVSAQDIYNVYLQSYIDLLTKTEGLIKEGYPVEQKRLEQLQEAKKALDEATDTETKLAAAITLTQEVTETINGIKRDVTTVEVLQKEIEEIETLRAQIKSMSDEEIAAAQAGAEAQLSKSDLIKGLNEAEIQAYDEKVNALTEKETSWWDKYADKQQEILDLKKEIDKSEVLSTEEKYERMKELDEAYSQSRKQQAADMATEIKGYVDQAVSIMQDAANLALDVVQNQATAEQAELEKKYRNGEIGEEEYNEKLTESKRKAAKEQYKIQMVQWSASILQATANIAQGVTQAIAQGGVAGIITGALVAAAGGVQIASIIASKPTPPNFSTGGIVGGSSYSGDNIAANLNSREMIMNMGQQKALWDFINGGNNGGGHGTNIVINNSASNIATAQPKITRNQIEIMIDARVNDSMKRGRYDQSLNMAQQGMSGDYYGI
jgi:hypothetical protein